MKLFFETAQQAERFLCLIPFGVLLAVILDLNSAQKTVGRLMDAVLFIFLGLFMNLFAMMFRENSMRGYYILGILVGVILYIGGVGRFIKCNKRRMAKRKEVFEAGKQETNNENRRST